MTDNKPSGLRQFPADFLFGAATSSYQIEGAVKEDGRGPSIWDVFAHTPGKVRGGETGDIACDSYHRMEEDLRLLRDLGVGAYRFSISWSRVQPDGAGAVNRTGLDYYRRLLDGLRGAGIVPAVTVYHWELPQALEDRGGWATRETAERFADYAGALAEALGDHVGMWITLNEPLQAAHQGYRVGTHAPGRTDPALAAAATHHLLLGHGLALEAIRAGLRAPAPVGIALDPTPIRPAGEGAEEAAAQLDAEHNRMYLDPVLHGRYPAEARADLLPPDALVRAGDMDTIGAPLGFLGVNYYRPHYLRLGDVRRGNSSGLAEYVPPQLPRSMMGWAVEPDGLYEILMRVQAEAPGLPLYITENGYGAGDYVNPEGQVNDFERVQYIHGHLDAAWRAIQDGVMLAGYFHWSLMDNFEWAWGYQPRFGLYFVDYGTQRRMPKRSAAFYAQVTRSGSLPHLAEQDGSRDGALPESAELERRSANIS